MDRVCFDCSNENHAKKYYQGTRKVAEHFGRTATYGTDIRSTIMKESTNIIAIPVRFNTVNAEIDKMITSKQLSEWVPQTSKLSANMGQAYNVILGQSTTFARSKIDSIKVWDAMSEIS